MNISNEKIKSIHDNSSNNTHNDDIPEISLNCSHLIQKTQSDKDPLQIDNNYEIRSTSKGIFHQILVTSAILILAAACGMPIGYSAVLLPQLYNSTEFLQIDIEKGSWIASVHSLATPIGSFASGPIADRFGRRYGLLFSIFPLVTGWSILGIAKSYTTIIIGRIIAGFAVGLIGAPAQILIAEIAIPKIRGILIGVPFVAYSMGILFVYALGSVLHWRGVAWCGNILPILSGLAILFIPESPVWLVRKGYIDKAKKSLIWLRGDYSDAIKELNTLINRHENEKFIEIQKKTITNTTTKTTTTTANNIILACCTKSSLKPLIIINVFHFLQILSGTFLVVFYAADIISEFGGNLDTMKAVVMTAVIRLLCTIIFCFLVLMLRRRHLIIASGIGSGLSALVLGIYMYCRLGNQSKSTFDMYFLAVCILCYIAFNTGFLVMPGIMIGELLPAKIRGQFAGYIFALFNISLFVIAKIFPLIQITLKTYGLFFMFSIASFIATIFMFLLLPETKGQTLGEIEDYFSKSNWIWFRRKKMIIKTNKNVNKNVFDKI